MRPRYGKLLHRWLVFETLESASVISELSPPLYVAETSAAARAWMRNPSSANRSTAEELVNRGNDINVEYSLSHAYSIELARLCVSATINPVLAVSAAVRASRYSTLYASLLDHNVVPSNANTAATLAELRIRVLTALEKYLPEPL